MPPEGHKDLGKKIFQILVEIIKHKSDLGLPKKWVRNYELSRNKHWKKNHGKAPLISANLLYAHRTRTTNLLTDNNPTFNVSRIGPPEESEEKTNVYQKLLKTAEYWWNEQEQQAVLEESIINGEMYGCTIEKVIFNEELEYGLGEVETETVDPFYFGFYPTSVKKIQKAEVILHYYPMTVREARRKWPHVADQIRADKEIIQELGDERKQVGASKQDTGLFGTIAGIVKSLINTADSTQSVDDEVLVVEAWAKDYTMIQLDDGSYEPKYPGYIRCVQTCNTGNVILSDKPNPSINPNLPKEQAMNTYLYDKFPFIMVPSVTDPYSPWGMSDYEQLEQLQIEVDKTLSQFTLWKDRASRLKIINPKDSGVPNSQFTNAPGIINPNNSLVANAIKYMQPPPIPTDLINALQVYKDYFFLVAGTFELEAAQTPGREVIAYKAIAALIERASTMLRGKIRNYSRMIRERGRMFISHAQNWYTEQRWITYEENGEEVSVAIKNSEILIPAKLTVVSGSTMPRSQVQEREEAITLYEKGAIDAEELLKKLDWPDRKRVIRRIREGPLTEFIDRLVKMGFPEELINIFQQISSLEDRDFKTAIKEGTLPSFPAIINSLIQRQGEEPQISAIEQLEIEAKKAEIERILTDAKLVKERIMTERMQQRVMFAGIGFDEQKLKIERAKVASEIENQRKQEDLELSKILETPSVKQRGTPPYRERGMKSNNKEIIS